MIFSSLLYHAIFSSLTENIPSGSSHIQKPETCEFNHDLSMIILYESFIPIEALVFEMGTSFPSSNELNTMIDTILMAKKAILSNVSTMAKFFNMSEIINEDQPLKGILEFRHNLMHKDQSNIFEKLIHNNIYHVSRCIREKVGILHQDQPISDPKRDEEFRKMIFRINEAILENLDVNDRIMKEKDEFYRNFQEISDIKKGKIALNLGGSIFNPKDLLQILLKIDVKDKSKAVREWIDAILEPIETLQLNRMKEFIDQKFLVIDFLKECVERKLGSYDSAFEARSTILRAAKLSDDEISRFKLRQEIESRKLLRMVENMKTKQWIIKSSKQIKEDYITYLLTLQNDDKAKLINHFKD